jgi:hypothetical protein
MALRTLASFAAAVSCLAVATAQRVVVIDGPVVDQLTVRVVDPWQPAAGRALPGGRKLLSVVPTCAVGDDAVVASRTRAIALRGLPVLEHAGGRRVFAYERLDTGDRGLLVADTDGEARDVFEAPEALAGPFAVATDARHVVFAREATELVIARLDAGVFASTGEPWRVVTAPSPILPQSVVAGPTHAFFATDDDRVFRCALADGGAPVDVTPLAPTSGDQGEHLVIAANGGTVAFLRSGVAGGQNVFVARTTGLAQRVDLPELDLHPVGFLPEGDGLQRVLLSDDGSRVMVTEAGVEDEIHCADTAPLPAVGHAVHVTRDDWFATYIGVHILPRFHGRTLAFASGHAGWSDWYAALPNGSVQNLTQTGAPEPPFFVGSLQVEARRALTAGGELSLERIGADWQLRRFDLAGAHQVLVADAVAPPHEGSSLLGQGDLVADTRYGQRLVAAADGRLRAALPPGVLLTPPVRASADWLGAIVHLPGGIGITAILLEDGTLLVGDLHAALPQLSADAGGCLHEVHADRVRSHGPNGAGVVPLPVQPVRVAVSGATR